MTGDNEILQLDLTESITEVPQANNIALFISVMEALAGEPRPLSELAATLDIRERTARYYVNFGRWMGWMVAAGDQGISLSSDGLAFVESKPARGRLFATTLFERPLVKTVQQLKRDEFDGIDEPQATRKACQQAIEGLTTLSKATADRRAGALASMLRWAYKPRRLDWSTGQRVEVATTPFDFHGQSFVTAFGARKFGGSGSIYIGFPHQVITFATGAGEGLQPKHWVRANYEADGGSAKWFGSIPINESTLAVARRGGPDLRRLLISCNPYLALVVTLMSPAHASRRPPVSLTRDMYGLRLWYRDRELGPPLEALATIAAKIDLIPMESVPHLRGRHVEDDLQPASDEDLADLLETTKIAKPVETTLSLSPGLASELRLPVGDGPTLWERMEPLRQALVDMLR